MKYFESLIRYHAILAINKRMRIKNEHTQEYQNFPNWCCVAASENILWSLYENWYSQAIYLQNISIVNYQKRQHSYVWVPYVTENEYWIITIDPTFSQLYTQKNKKTWVEKMIWKQRNYKTNRARWISLYPTKIIHSWYLMKQRRYIPHQMQLLTNPERFLEKVSFARKKTAVPIL